MVLKQQLQVLVGLAEEIVEEVGEENSTSVVEIRRRSREQLKVIEVHYNNIERMIRQADGIYTSLTNLLDLKQKHANAIEARFARDQATLTARQGQTIMVFTLVTIVFLPMSFIAAFFAINVENWSGENGSGRLTVGYISKYM
ncbi:hypothetical protein LTS18_004914, partial [Coniosporium uncinatum]